MMRKRNLLYVEDDPGSRKVMSLLVSRLDKAVQLTIFENSTNFLERVEALESEPDILLLDIHVMPYDGFRMLEMLRGHPRFAEVMVIALTASVMNEEINRLKKAGFDGVLAKPLNFHTFPNTFEQILSSERVWTVNR